MLVSDTREAGSIPAEASNLTNTYMNDIDDAWEKHAQACNEGYYKNPRWKEVATLRKAGETLKANGLVDTIRYEWGLY